MPDDPTPVAACASCGRANPASAERCIHCGAEFDGHGPPAESLYRIDDQASLEALGERTAPLSRGPVRKPFLRAVGFLSITYCLFLARGIDTSGLGRQGFSVMALAVVALAMASIVTLDVLGLARSRAARSRSRGRAVASLWVALKVVDGFLLGAGCLTSLLVVVPCLVTFAFVACCFGYR